MSHFTFSLHALSGQSPSWQGALHGCPQPALGMTQGWLQGPCGHGPSWHRRTQECRPQGNGRPQGRPQERPSRWHMTALRNWKGKYTWSRVFEIKGTKEQNANSYVSARMTKQSMTDFVWCLSLTLIFALPSCHHQTESMTANQEA